MSLQSLSSRSFAVLISGGGTTLKNLIERRLDGGLAAEISLVVSSNPQAAGLTFAREAGIPIAVVDHRSHSPKDFGSKIFAAIEGTPASWIAMGGFLRHLEIPSAWTDRVINIHPSLIPAFCGKGFYGKRVHQAVIDHGCKISGCTVHIVDHQYDHGPIIAQRPVEVSEDDTAESLAERVFATECRLYPAVINALIAGAVRRQGRVVRIDPPLQVI